MIELILCIIACASLVIGFKIFEKLGISSLQAIVINYGTAGLIGFLYEPEPLSILTKVDQPWFLNACILGLVFIFNFYIMALSTQKIGASVTSVAGKMSLVITVLFWICYNYYYLQESTPYIQFGGIALAIASVFFITRINTQEVNKKFIFLPFLLFLGGGFIDISLGYNQVVHLKGESAGLFSMTTFSVAFLAGLLMLVFQFIKGKEKIHFKNIIGGIVLGVVNWFSIFLLLLTLKNPAWDKSTVYTIINIGILLLVVVCGVLLFKEKLNRKQWIGIILALCAIILVSIT
jgi:drug/metabolite transporter (DMT)-like permease